MGKILLILSCVLLAACSTQQYRYVASAEPGDDASQSSGRAELTFPAAGGKVQVSSMGVVEVEPSRGARRVPAIHLRLTLSNEGGQNPWEVDTRDQKVSFPSGGQVSPAFVNSDASLPKLTIPAGEMRFLDLYFALPQGETTAKDLPSFTFRWRIVAGGQPAEQSTIFTRHEVSPGPVVVSPYDPYPYAPGWGPYWWGGAYYGPWGPRPGPFLQFRAR